MPGAPPGNPFLSLILIVCFLALLAKVTSLHGISLTYVSLNVHNIDIHLSLSLNRCNWIYIYILINDDKCIHWMIYIIIIHVCVVFFKLHTNYDNAINYLALVYHACVCSMTCLHSHLQGKQANPSHCSLKSHLGIKSPTDSAPYLCKIQR